MPQIGRYYVPRFRLANLIPAAKQIFDKFESSDAESELIAQLLGYAGRESGTFYTRIKDLMSYGLLVQSGRGRFKVTDLAKRLTYPKTKDEGDIAIKQAFMNIQFWHDLYDKFGDKIPQNDLWVDISKIAGIDAPKAKELQDMIRNAYLDDVSTIPPSVLSEEQKSFMQPDASTKNMEPPAGRGTTQRESTIEIQFGKYAVKMPVDEAQRDLAKAWTRLKKHMDFYVEDEIDNRSGQTATAGSNASDDQLLQ